MKLVVSKLFLANNHQDHFYGFHCVLAMQSRNFHGKLLWSFTGTNFGMMIMVIITCNVGD